MFREQAVSVGFIDLCLGSFITIAILDQKIEDGTKTYAGGVTPSQSDKSMIRTKRPSREAIEISQIIREVIDHISMSEWLPLRGFNS
jgi:hypothetical protein